MDHVRQKSNNMAEQNNDCTGMLLIISGPSGAGKTTITRRLQGRMNAVFSVSVTTRPKSPKDVEGVDYNFVSEEAFRELRDNGQLLEWAEVFGNYYGTPRQPVLDQLVEGRLVMLEIDVEGAIQVRRNMPEVFAIFILPPDEEELLARLRQRKREGEEVIQRRFAEAKNEINRAKTCGVYNIFIVNDVLERAIEQAYDRIMKEWAERRKKAETG